MNILNKESNITENNEQNTTCFDVLLDSIYVQHKLIHQNNTYLWQGDNDSTVIFQTLASRKNLVTIVADDKYINITPLGKRNEINSIFSSSAEIVNHEMHSEIIYKNFLQDADLQYVLYDKSVKENIIINKPMDNYKFIFEIETGGVVAQYNKQEKTIQFLSSDRKCIFAIPAPFMIDSNNAKCYDVDYSLQEINNKYILEIEANIEWLNSEDRIFPITIDPSIVTNDLEHIKTQDSIFDTSYLFGLTGTSRRYAHFKINNSEIKSFISTNRIISATLRLHIKEFVNDFPEHRFVIKPSKGFGMGPDGTDSIYSMLPANITSDSVIEIDITKYILDKKNIDKGFVFDTLNNQNNNKQCYVKFTTEYEDGKFGETQHLKPLLQMNYHNEKSINSEKTNFNVCGSGEGSVDLFSGMLNFTHVDNLNMINCPNLNIMHTYNSNYINDPTNNQFKYGKGWMLNINQKIIFKDLPKKTYGEELPIDSFANGANVGKNLVYVDGQGYEHTFNSRYYELITVNNDTEIPNKQIKQYIPSYLYDKNNSGHFKEISNGKGLFLNESSSAYIITNESGMEMLFEKNQGNLIEFRKDCGELRCFIYYDNNSKRALVKDELGRSAVLNYTINGILHSINFSSGESISFEYDYSKILLAKIIYNNDDYTTFTYDNMDRLTSITGPSGHCQQIVYDHVSRAISISEKSNISNISYDVINKNVQVENTFMTTNKCIYLNYLSETCTISSSDVKCGVGYIFNRDGTLKTVYEDAGVHGFENVSAKGTVKYNYVNILDLYNPDTQQGKDKYEMSQLSIDDKSDNLIKNPSFEVINGELEKWYSNNANYKPISGVKDSNAIYFIGDINSSKSLTQEISISSISTNKRYVLSGWAQSNSAITASQSWQTIDKMPRFEITAEIIYINGAKFETKNYRATFNPHEQGWQFSAIPIFFDKKQKIYQIKISLTYDYNYGAVSFDKVGLYEQEALLSNVNINNFTEVTNDEITFHQSLNNMQKVEKLTITDHLDGDKSYNCNFQYDSKGNLISQKNEENILQEYNYDKCGNVIKETTSCNGIEDFKKQWDYENYEYLKEYKDNTAELKYYYDSYGNILKNALPASAYIINNGLTHNVPPSEINYGYDVNKMLEKISLDIPSSQVKNSNSTNFIYRKRGLLMGMFHNGFNYGFVYDGFSRLKKVYIDSVLMAEYEYKRSDSFINVLDAVEAITIKLPSGYSEIKYYDKHGTLVKVSSKEINDNNFKDIYNYQHDIKNKVFIEKDESIAKTYETCYNEKGKIISKTEKDSNTQLPIFSTSYNYIQRGTSKTHSFQNISRSYYIEYDKKDTLKEQIKKIDSPIGSYQNHSYDKYGRILHYGFSMGGVELSYKDNHVSRTEKYGYYPEKLDYKYDNSGKLSSISGTKSGELGRPYNVKLDWVYDNANRLSWEYCNDFVGEGTADRGYYQYYNRYAKEYKYDDGGNLKTKKEYEYSLEMGKGALKNTKEYTYYNGWRDRLKNYNGSQDIPYDEKGNPLKWFNHNTGSSDASKILEWDENSRLIKVTNGEDVIEYKYNVFGQTIQKIVSTMIYYYYYDDSSNLVLEHRKGINGSNYDYKFIYYYDLTGASGCEVIGHPALDGKYKFLKNSFGDIINVMCSGKCNIAYSYDAWGKIMGTSTLQNGLINVDLQCLRYRGYYYDKDTGLFMIPPSVYGYTKYYDPEIGRFLSPASIESLNPYSINGLNLYSLPCNNPVIFMPNSANIYSSALSGGYGAGLGGTSISGGDISSVSGGASQVNTTGLGILGQVVGGVTVATQLIGNGFGKLAGLFASQAAGLAGELTFSAMGHMTKSSNKLAESLMAMSNTNAARSELFGTLGKVAKGIGIGLFVLDLGLSAYNNFSNSNLSMGQKIGFTALDWGVSAGVFALGMMSNPIGALVGLGVWALYEFWLKDVIRGWFI